MQVQTSGPSESDRILDGSDDKIDEGWLDHDWTLIDKHPAANLSQLTNEQRKGNKIPLEGKNIAPGEFQTSDNHFNTKDSAQSWNVTELYKESMVNDPWDSPSQPQEQVPFFVCCSISKIS